VAAIKNITNEIKAGMFHHYLLPIILTMLQYKKIYILCNKLVIFVNKNAF